MSPEAERLDKRLGGLHNLSGKEVALKVVTELGITDEMVERVGYLDEFGKGVQHQAKGVAVVLSTLLEVSRQP